MVIAPNGYLVCENGVCRGVFAELPAAYGALPFEDMEDRFILPGFVDLHTHAPQSAFRGTGMDMELVEWLTAHAFPEESRYADLAYAEKAYRIFTDELVRSATTRAVIFATVHTPATLLLMDLLEQAGLGAYVGKVNMDRNAPPPLCEASAARSAADTTAWLDQCRQRGYKTVRPILTPRFIPSCSDELLAALGALQKRYGVPVQSHLSENISEIEWVKELCPQAAFYGQAYDRFGLFGANGPAVMAHCVHSGDAELELIRQRGVFIAHCPQSNMNLASGIAPVRRYLDRGLRMGLGTDAAGGASLSMLRAVSDAIQCSKLLWRLAEPTLAPLKLSEALYLATKGGGAFFGRVGSFEDGYAFDAVVLDDAALPHPQPLTPAQRLERLVYLADDRHICAKWVDGRRLF